MYLHNVSLWGWINLSGNNDDMLTKNVNEVWCEQLDRQVRMNITQLIKVDVSVQLIWQSLLC